MTDDPSEKAHVSRISEPCLKAASDIRVVCVTHAECVGSHHVVYVACVDLKQKTEFI